MAVTSEVLLERTEKRKKSEIWSGVLLALLMLAALGLTAQRIFHIATGPKPPGPGVTAPGFAGALLTGDQTTLEAHRGKIVVLDFWATWCPPCVASLPHLQNVATEYAARGVVVLGVNQEPGQEEGVRAFLEDRGVTFPSVVDPGSIHVQYGVYSFPTSFVIDRAGVIRAAFRGPVSERALRAAIDEVLASPAS